MRSHLVAAGVGAAATALLGVAALALGPRDMATGANY
jgi:hypothetical protein